MTHHEITMLFVALAALLGVARALGEVARHFRQPAVLGEILAGVVLGPTIFGAISPAGFAAVFPAEGAGAIGLQAITTLAVVLFLLVAGMEVDLSIMLRIGKSAVLIGACGLIAPFGMGFGLAQWMPTAMGMEPGADKLVFSLFLGTALAISALPVIAKTLIDLRLFRTDLGMLVMAVAIFHDLVGWMIFAVVLSMMATGASETGEGGGSILLTILMTVLFVGWMLTVGRSLLDRMLPWVQAHMGWPNGVIAFAVAAGLMGAAFTEYIGIHAIFGAFIVGVATGDSRHLRQKTRTTIDHFVASIFAPLFFASIGLQVDFVANFDLALVLVVLAIACIGETVGCAVGALWAGFPRRQAWAIGFALNARGAMEIVLATLALQYGVIGERLFVALVVMALVTSMIAGPMMQRMLARKAAAKLADHVCAFVPRLGAESAQGAIAELAMAGALATGASALEISDAAWEREQTMGTGLPGAVAVPHGIVAGLEKPFVAVGVSHKGIHFDAPDGEPSRLILLVVASKHHAQEHLEILAEIARAFQDSEYTQQAIAADGITAFRAVVNIAVAEQSEPAAHSSKPAAAG